MNHCKLIIILIFFTSIDASFQHNGIPMSKKEIDTAYAQAQKETGSFVAATGLSAGIGSVLGLMGGSQIGKKAGQIVGTDTALGIPHFMTINTARTIGASSGGYLGGQIGSNLSLYYYARKYAVPKKVALAAIITNEPLAIPEIKQMFLAAYDHNKQQLKDLLINYLNVTVGSSSQLSLKVGDRMNFLIYVLSNLYFNNSLIVPPKRGVFNQAKKLMVELFGVDQDKTTSINQKEWL